MRSRNVLKGMLLDVGHCQLVEMRHEVVHRHA